MATDGFGKRLRQARGDRDVSMRELAQQSGLSQPTIGSYEDGKSYPDIRFLEALAKSLSVCPCWLAFGMESAPGRHKRVEKARLLLQKALLEL